MVKPLSEVPRRRRGGRRVRVLVMAGVVAAVLAVAAAAVGVGRATSESGAKDRQPPATAVVSRQDLTDLRTVRGVLAFGEPTAMVGRLPGTVTQLAPVGSEVRRGGALIFVDDRPVVLFYGPLPMWRELGVGSRGRDVRQVEENLVALGYRGITVDDRYTTDTARAVRRWQTAGGLARTGRLSPGQIFFAAGAVRVADHRARPGDPSTGPMLGLTGTARLVSAQLPAADERLAVTGTKVTVVLPDDRPVAGTVAEVRPGAAGGQNGPGAGSGLTVLVRVLDQRRVASLDSTDVQLQFVVAQRRAVLTVPVTALLALSEGGYGVELVAGTGTRVVLVKVGMFANGRVEVEGPGLVEGLRVGVPA